MLSSRDVKTGRIERNEEEARKIKNQEAEKKKPAETRKNIPRYAESKEGGKSLPCCGERQGLLRPARHHCHQIGGRVRLRPLRVWGGGQDHLISEIKCKLAHCSGFHIMALVISQLVEICVEY